MAVLSGKNKRFGMPLKGLCYWVCVTELRSPQEVLIKFLKLKTLHYQSLTYMDVCVKSVLLLFHADAFLL